MRSARGETADEYTGRADIIDMDNQAAFANDEKRKEFAEHIKDRGYDDMDELSKDRHLRTPQELEELKREEQDRNKSYDKQRENTLEGAVDADAVLQSLLYLSDDAFSKVSDKSKIDATLQNAFTLMASYYAALQVQNERKNNKEVFALNCIKYPAGSTPMRQDLLIKKEIKRLFGDIASFEDIINKNGVISEWKASLNASLNNLETTTNKYVHDIALEKTKEDAKRYLKNGLFMGLGIGAISGLAMNADTIYDSIRNVSIDGLETHTLSGGTQEVMDTINQKVTAAIEVADNDALTHPEYHDLSKDVQDALKDGALTDSEIADLEAKGFDITKEIDVTSTEKTIVVPLDDADLEFGDWYDNHTEIFDKTELNIQFEDGKLNVGAALDPAYHNPSGTNMSQNLELNQAFANGTLKAIVVNNGHEYPFDINSDYTFDIPKEIMDQIGSTNADGRFVCHADRIHFAEVPGGSNPYNSIATIPGDGTAEDLMTSKTISETIKKELITITPPEVVTGQEFYDTDWRLPPFIPVATVRTPYQPLGRAKRKPKDGEFAGITPGDDMPVVPVPEPPQPVDGPDEKLVDLKDLNEITWRPIPRSGKENYKAWPFELDAKGNTTQAAITAPVKRKKGAPSRGGKSEAYKAAIQEAWDKRRNARIGLDDPDKKVKEWVSSGKKGWETRRYNEMKELSDAYNAERNKKVDTVVTVDTAETKSLRKASLKAHITQVFGKISHTEEFQNKIIEKAKNPENLDEFTMAWAKEIYSKNISPLMKKARTVDSTILKGKESGIIKNIAALLKSSILKVEGIVQGKTDVQGEFKKLFPKDPFKLNNKAKLFYALDTPVFIVTRKDLVRITGARNVGGICYTILEGGKKQNVIIVPADDNEKVSLDTLDHEITHYVNRKLFPGYEELDQKRFASRLSPFTELQEEITAHLHQPNLDELDIESVQSYITPRLVGPSAGYDFIKNTLSYIEKEEEILRSGMFVNSTESLDKKRRLLEKYNSLKNFLKENQENFYKHAEYLVDTSIAVAQKHGHKGVFMLENMSPTKWYLLTKDKKENTGLARMYRSFEKKQKEIARMY